ncbi:MAG: hypothetical protein ABIN94_00370 [Ferruginibacter sp.]
MKKLKIIVGGFLGIMPAGGITWDYVQYPLGFLLMGHDVYYIEDTRLYPIYQKAGSNWSDASPCVQHLQQVMEHFGMKDRWAYRDEASGECFGLSESKIKELCSSADMFINISCSTFLRDEYLQIPVRVLIDSDPMFTQIQYSVPQMFTPGKPAMTEMVNAHNYLFSFGENLGAPDCLVPDCDLQWNTTRQPVCLQFWNNRSTDTVHSSFTTLMNWTAGKPLQYNGETWGQKDIEFKKILELPQLVPDVSLSMIINQTGATAEPFSRATIEAAGWRITDADSNAGNWRSYQDFIASSMAEFSVAKETYVKARTGWFSGRSACYLAAGKPVITQDTGWSKYIPAGNGLFAFKDLQSARESINEVVANYSQHAKHAVDIAQEYFDSRKVLGKMLQQIF